MTISMISLIYLILALYTSSNLAAPGKEKQAIYPKYRIWNSPGGGEEPKFNSPSLEWPARKKNSYDIRLSTSRDFSTDLIEKKNIPFAIYNPHKQLQEGMWYWQYKVNGGEWGEVDSFFISSHTPRFETPSVDRLIEGIPITHPRVLVDQAGLEDFRIRASSYKESQYIIKEANHYLGLPPPDEHKEAPDFEGNTELQNEKIALLSSRNLGDEVANILITLTQAYILTGDQKYFKIAREWMLEISTWDTKGITHLNNFGDSNIMLSMALGVDTFWELLNVGERAKMIDQAAARAQQFYLLWINNTEAKSATMHVWQHILHRLVQTSVALMGEVPQATDWMEYLYEMWIAQSPKMGEKDGAWFNGTGYVRMNILTLLDVPAIFQTYTGVDFIWSEWYANFPIWMNYAFPPNSTTDGFCNDGDKYTKPSLEYAGFSDAFARVTGNAYAAWYAEQFLNILGKELADDKSFRWFRIQRGYQMDLPKPLERFDLPQAALFPDVGLVYMNTDLENANTNLMLSIRSSPFGPLGHTHADHNTFNIAYGGKRLFYNTGYRPSMNDPHFLAWHKHTQGHNGILIDGHGQPFDGGAFGMISRFIHGRQISYAVGDASNAYSASDLDQVDYGVKHFRRHYLMLRPSIIVIYDELEADHNAEWSWLIHHNDALQVDAKNKTIIGEIEIAGGQVSLFASTPIDFQLSNRFSVEPDNFTKKVDEDGNLVDFANQWHFKGVTKKKIHAMRYLAIIQVRSDKRYEPVLPGKVPGSYIVGDWEIKAGMDIGAAAILEVNKKDSSAAFVSSGKIQSYHRSYEGYTSESSKLFEIVEGKPTFQEAVDSLPAAVLKVLIRHQ